MEFRMMSGPRAPLEGRGEQLADLRMRRSAACRKPGGRDQGTGEGGRAPKKEASAMPVMGFVKFERFFQVAGGVDVDRNDMKRYLEFVNRTIYDLLVIGQAHAESNGRDIIEPSDLTITAGLQEIICEFRKLDEEIELRPILDYIAVRPPLSAAMSDDTQQGLPEVFGGISVALARTLKILDPSARAVLPAEWDRAFRIFDLLI
jgi:Domain of unknown function (DUF1931)